ncbi:unnamed protein product [Moneuplotes crassus]|uniref:ATP-dependent DNA ligase family profile domain-containing protein n=1 Tax=Euplotes crassus TaxID=5936 RepID=A0AAD1XM98_EUPCR|nr:unnamed protein product [Moneuplotes crassus]
MGLLDTLNKNKSKREKQLNIQKKRDICRKTGYLKKKQICKLKHNNITKKREAKEIYKSLSSGPSKPHPNTSVTNGMDFKGVMLAGKYDGSQNIDGWYMSEKLDGLRCYFDGKTFRTRNGNLFNPPPEFRENFPEGVHLDGELWIGRNRFHECHSVVRAQTADKGWYKVKYLIFDAPQHPGTFKQRLEYLKDLLQNIDDGYLTLHEHKICVNAAEVQLEMEKIRKLGGEGLILRDPDSFYEFSKRSNFMLKVKDFHDDEATIIDYENGTGKYKDLMGAVIVQNKYGIKFKVGSGFSDEQRKEKIQIGRKITYKYAELTKKAFLDFLFFEVLCRSLIHL